MSSWFTGHLKSILASKDRTGRDNSAKRSAGTSTPRSDDGSSHSVASRGAAEAVLSSSPTSTDSAGMWPLDHAASPCSCKGRKWIVGKQYPVWEDTVFYMCLRDYKKLTSLLQQRQESDVEIDRFFIRIDDLLLYYPFCADFGPLSMACIHRFSDLMTQAMARRANDGKKIVLCSSADPEARTNAACLIACWLVLECGYTAEEAWELFCFDAGAGEAPAFLAFREASYDKRSFPLHVIDVLGGLQRARDNGLIDLKAFDLEKYDRYDHPSVADLHVVVPGVFVAFKGPKLEKKIDTMAGVVELTTGDYLDIFREEGVSDVVRLNHKEYEEDDFVRAGIEHHDIFFEDCSVPSAAVLQTWFEMCARRRGVVAVHCKAGLGRTGTLIAVWMMRKYKFTGREMIGYIRLMRPGSILGPQQEFLVKNQELFWSMGDPDLYNDAGEGPLRAPLSPPTVKVPSPPSSRGSTSSSTVLPRPPPSNARNIMAAPQPLTLPQHIALLRKHSSIESALSAKSTPKLTPPATPNLLNQSKASLSPTSLQDSCEEEEEEDVGDAICECAGGKGNIWTKESLRELRARENTMAMHTRNRQRLLAEGA